MYIGSHTNKAEETLEENNDTDGARATRDLSLKDACALQTTFKHRTLFGSGQQRSTVWDSSDPFLTPLPRQRDRWRPSVPLH